MAARTAPSNRPVRGYWAGPPIRRLPAGCRDVLEVLGVCGHHRLRELPRRYSSPRTAAHRRAPPRTAAHRRAPPRTAAVRRTGRGQGCCRRPRRDYSLTCPSSAAKNRHPSSRPTAPHCPPPGRIYSSSQTAHRPAEHPASSSAARPQRPPNRRVHLPLPHALARPGSRLPAAVGDHLPRSACRCTRITPGTPPCPRPGVQWGWFGPQTPVARGRVVSSPWRAVRSRAGDLYAEARPGSSCCLALLPATKDVSVSRRLPFAGDGTAGGRGTGGSGG